MVGLDEIFFLFVFQASFVVTTIIFPKLVEVHEDNIIRLFCIINDYIPRFTY